MYTVLIPAYNEESTVRNVLKIATAAPGVGQVILVNDGSTDRTEERSKNISPLIEIVSHSTNRGKGAAIRTGLGMVKYESVVFLDADLLSLTPEKVSMLAEPILANRADFVKARFTRSRGRVTELAVKPMMQILFPGKYFEQPISGQFAARLSFLKKIKIVENWGLDIGILLDAISHGQRIVEVDIGHLDHKAQSDHALTAMSEQVLLTMIQKAGLLSNKYRLVLFSFDEALIKNYSVTAMMKAFGREAEYKALQAEKDAEQMLSLEYYIKFAELFEGITTQEIKKYADSLELRTYALDVITYLKKRQMEVGVVALHPSPLVKEIADRLGVTLIEGLDFVQKGKTLTGELKRKSVHNWFSSTLEQGFLGAMTRMARKVNADLQGTIAVAADVESLPLLEFSGFGISYRSRDKSMKYVADKTISILPELLVLVE